MPEDCIFCQIVAGTIPTTFVFESDGVVAFNDIHPDAPTHVQVIPKRHIASLADTSEADSELLGELLLAAAAVARQAGVDKTGYRCVINTRQHGGQLVPHLHLHVMGGRQMGPSHG